MTKKKDLKPGIMNEMSEEEIMFLTVMLSDYMIVSNYKE